MREDDRQCVFMTRTNVQEVNVEAVDLGAELRKAIQFRLATTPVVVRPPILDERPKLCERYALRPILDCLTFRPARLLQTLFQITESALRRLILEWRDSGVGLGEQAGPARYG